MTKEHLFPQWMIDRTGTYKTGIRWLGGTKIPARSATLPLCQVCNSRFGSELEGKASRIFSDLEAGKGLSDVEAELLVRWLWKLEGLVWTFLHPENAYTAKSTLADRILRPIDGLRGGLVLAVGLIDHIDPVYGDEPLGLDSYNEVNAVFVAGVFLKVAIMVLLEGLSEYIPPEFSLYRLAAKPNQLSEAKLFYPKVGFFDDTEAVAKAIAVAQILSPLHDNVFRELSKPPRKLSS